MGRRDRDVARLKHARTYKYLSERAISVGRLVAIKVSHDAMGMFNRQTRCQDQINV